MSLLADPGRHLTPHNMPIFNSKNALFSIVWSTNLVMLENAAHPMGPDAPATSVDTCDKLRAHLMALGGTLTPLTMPIFNSKRALFGIVLSKKFACLRIWDAHRAHFRGYL